MTTQISWCRFWTPSFAPCSCTNCCANTPMSLKLKRNNKSGLGLKTILAHAGSDSRKQSESLCVWVCVFVCASECRAFGEHKAMVTGFSQTSCSFIISQFSHRIMTTCWEKDGYLQYQSKCERVTMEEFGVSVFQILPDEKAKDDRWTDVVRI